jgi:hypothetical protein
MLNISSPNTLLPEIPRQFSEDDDMARLADQLDRSLKRISKQQIEELHPTAKVEQIKNNQLFLVAYPGLTLALSYTTLIAFKYSGRWHFTLDKLSKQTSKHQHFFREMFFISHWYESRNDMLKKLKMFLPLLTDPTFAAV